MSSWPWVCADGYNRDVVGGNDVNRVSRSTNRRLVKLRILSITIIGLFALFVGMAATVGVALEADMSTSQPRASQPRQYEDPADGSCVEKLDGFYRYEPNGKSFWYCDPTMGLMWNGNGYTCPQFRSGEDKHPMACFHRQLKQHIIDSTDAGYYR